MPVLRPPCTLSRPSYYQRAISRLEGESNLGVGENVYSGLYTCEIMKCVRVMCTCYAMTCSTRKIEHVWMHTRDACTQEVHSIHICWEIYTCEHVKSYMSVWTRYAELQLLRQWLDQCTKMYLAWCCSSWSQTLDADHYKRWWSWIFMTHFMKMKFHFIQMQFHENAISWNSLMYTILNSYQEAVDHLWLKL